MPGPTTRRTAGAEIHSGIFHTPFICHNRYAAKSPMVKWARLKTPVAL